MSSFRPEPRPGAAEFVPQAWGLATAGGFVLPETPVSPEGPSSESGCVAPDASGNAETLAPSDASPEEDPTAAGAHAPDPTVDVAAIERDAYARGLADAAADQARLEAAASNLEAVARQWREAAAACLAAHRELALDLCRDAVVQWVGDELAGDPARYAALLESGGAACEGEHPLRVRVPDPDLAALEAALPDRLRALRDDAGWELVADAQLEAGDFRIEAGPVSLDGRRSAIAARLRAHWDETALREAAPPPAVEAESE